MAGKLSLPDVSQKVIADAEQYINEFRRAERAQRSTTAAMEREADKFTKSIKKKFSAGDIGKSLLQGFGIGSGFAVAQQAAEMISGYYERAAKAAQEIEASTARSLELTLKRIAAAGSPETQLANLIKREAAARAKFNALNIPDPTTNMAASVPELAGTQFANELTAEQQDERKKLSKELDDLGDEITSLRAKLVDTKLTEFFSDANVQAKALADTSAKIAAARFKSKTDDQKTFESANAAALAGMAQVEAKLQATADAAKNLADPMRETREQIERIQAITASRPDLLGADEAAKAVAELNRQLDDMQSKRVDDALSNFFGDMDAESKRNIESMNKVKTAAETMEQELSQMWNSVSDRAGQSFADMVLTGEAAFGNLVDIVARAALEMVARLAIINPILNMLFSGFTGFSLLPAFFGAGATAAAGATTTATASGFGGYFADGGTLEPGKWGIAGEDGPEPIFAGSAPMTVIPNIAAGRGGNTYYVDARGADAGAVDRISAALKALAGPGVVEMRAIAAVSQSRMRGAF